MANFSPVEFFRQVKAEMKKITWPSRRETGISTAAVFVMVLMASVFLFAADQILATVVHWILGL